MHVPPTGAPPPSSRPPAHHLDSTRTATPRQVHTVTVRDFLTARHGFTLPSSHAYVASYDAARAHACRSLFRNGRAFGVHFHLSVNEDCDGGEEGGIKREEWEGVIKGQAGGGGKVVVWAHFERRRGVGLFGEVLGEGVRAAGRKKKKGREEGRRRVRVREGYALPPLNASPWVYFSRYTEIVPRPLPLPLRTVDGGKVSYLFLAGVRAQHTAIETIAC
ncbi:hypothetical protein P171DRAFT_152479 [Karstenula rhodostoma CBS 690.94]|uniref:Uncharacterized protein n=1 Tax=Karstenula rhodostoma CBS 690.94 TaxID=1392251 RepID=A0A9P4PVQ5_9PLEO|nr:hypothetical protein P171DRAFT_152479 [Karstenula rhodostoma CBS 690.94]